MKSPGLFGHVLSVHWLGIAAALVLFTLIGVSTIAGAPDAIRGIDFKNFTYPWLALDDWPDHLEWMSLAASHSVTLVDGRWRDPESEADPIIPFRGLSLDQVTYGNLDSPDAENAIVVLRFDTGGTMCWYYVYIFAYESSGSKLMAYFHSGDRASSGLYRVYSELGQLVVELYDPQRRQGDCCSKGFERTKFRWDGRQFARVGGIERGNAANTSRRPVSVFGLPLPDGIRK